MHGRYRRIVIAAVGWLIVSASPPANSVAANEQALAQQQTADGVRSIAETYREQVRRAESSKDGEPCEPGDDRRYSDLCAQWKAADAASDSAWWAWVGSLVSAFSLLCIIATLALNAQSNWISVKTARRQLRAYMVVEHTGYFGIIKDGAKPNFSLVFRNAGATPAVNVRGWVHGEIGPHRYTAKLKEGVDVLEHSIPDNVGPGCQTGAHYRPFECSAEQRGAFLEERASFYIWSVLEYEDVFGKRYRLETIYRSRGPSDPVAVDPVLNREIVVTQPHWWQRNRKSD